MKNQFNNNNKKKAALNIKNFEKKFETFEKMIEELKSLHSEFNKLFANLGTDYETTPLNAIFCLVDYMNDGHIPNALTGDNLPCALSISANRASLKTTQFISFNWNFKYNRDKEITDVTANVAVYMRDKNTEELEYTLSKLSNTENGWKDITRNTKVEK